MSTRPESKEAQEERPERYEAPAVAGVGDVVGRTLGDEGEEPEKKFMAGGFLGSDN